MSAIGTIGMNLAGSAVQGASTGIGGAVGGAVTEGLNSILGINRAQDRRQQQQAEALAKIQYDYNSKMLQQQYGMQREMYDYTYNKNTPLQQVMNLKAAGLNPALAYSGGANSPGGVTAGSGGSGVGPTGSAADSSSQQQANTAQMGMALNLRMQESQIAVNEATANKLNADAENAGANTETTNASRKILIENLKQAGIAQWYENVRTDYMNLNKAGDSSGETVSNPVYQTEHMA